MKYDWKKLEKAYYMPGKEPELIDVPAQKYIMIDGTGNPNEEPFARRTAALYSLTYTIKMMPKKGILPEGYVEYSVFPLEGVYTLPKAPEAGQPLPKDKLIYTLMIRQPDFVTPAVFAAAIEMAGKKKPPVEMLADARFEEHTDGLCVQMLHLGPYDDEPESFARMEAFCRENGLQRIGHPHREIYLGDPRKQKPEKLKTVLRYPVKRA